MSTITVTTTTVEPCQDAQTPAEAELAAVAFLARFSGRTLDAYRHDLRNLFQCATDHGLPVLETAPGPSGDVPIVDG
jgi:hypothetical protein